MSTTAVARTPPFPVRQFTLDEYHRMIESAVLQEDDPVELLEGWIVPKMPRGPRHDALINQAQELLRNLLPVGWTIRVQSAVSTADSEPEPDLAIVLGPASRYLEHHPGPDEVALIIEVAESSLARDREIKGRVYARAGVPAYWVLNLVETRLEVYSEPAGFDDEARYGRRTLLGPDERVPLILGGRRVADLSVGELFPSR